MRKFIVSIIICISLFNCRTAEPKISYEPSLTEGCAKMTDVTSKFKCVSRLLKTFEGVNNAKVEVTSEKLDRIDWEYVKVKETYCFVSQETKEKYLCFESERSVYDPTFLGKVYNTVTKVGIGGLIGILFGVYISG